MRKKQTSSSARPPARPPARTLYPTLLVIRVFVGARYTFVRILFLMYPWIYLDVSCVYPKGYMYPDCILMYLKNLSSMLSVIEKTHNTVYLV